MKHLNSKDYLILLNKIKILKIRLLIIIVLNKVKEDYLAILQALFLLTIIIQEIKQYSLQLVCFSENKAVQIQKMNQNLQKFQKHSLFPI